jgi:site-specific DNA-methyltransferase (adenine-specific)
MGEQDVKFELNQLYNIDCMEAMKEFPDGYFDLAVVDPPYGGGGG